MHIFLCNEQRSCRMCDIASSVNVDTYKSLSLYSLEQQNIHWHLLHEACFKGYVFVLFFKTILKQYSHAHVRFGRLTNPCNYSFCP